MKEYPKAQSMKYTKHTIPALLAKRAEAERTMHEAKLELAEATRSIVEQLVAKGHTECLTVNWAKVRSRFK